jgi:primosomal protein N' (replication factor Y) (superfamily II helicase)
MPSPIPPECPECGAGLADAGRPRRRARAGGGGALFPDARRLVMASDTIPGPAAAAAAAEAIADAAGGPDHRHADRRQGLALPAPDAGRRGRCRSRPGRRRPARGGAHLQLLHQVSGPRGARRGAGQGAAADLLAGASGDAGAGLGRPRRLHGGGGGGTPPRPLAALRPPRRADREREDERSGRPARRATSGLRGAGGGEGIEVLGPAPGAAGVDHPARAPPAAAAAQGAARRGGAAAAAGSGWRGCSRPAEQACACRWTWTRWGFLSR